MSDQDNSSALRRELEQLRARVAQLEARHDERGAAAERQSHAQQLEILGVLAGGIAHDFNNLLVGILGSADLAYAQLHEDSPAKENLEDIIHSARRAADLCHSMLAYSDETRVDSPKIALNELLREMEQLLGIATSRRARLTLELTAGIPAVEADPTDIRQAVMNLVTNAAEAVIGYAGEIRVSTKLVGAGSTELETLGISDPGYFVLLSVVDNGFGMDAETLDKVFDPFFTTKGTGRGLGLAAVQRIVESHQGLVRVSSTIGEGSTFCIAFPVEPVEEIAAIPPPPPSGSPSSGLVLLVDDDPVVRKVGAKMLESIGYDVVIASDGREGVDKFNEHHDGIDCVILDMTMPKMNGVEAFQRMRQIRPEVPVVLTSGYNEQTVTAQFGDDEPDGFLTKPFTAAEIASTLRSAPTSRANRQRTT